MKETLDEIANPERRRFLYSLPTLVALAGAVSACEPVTTGPDGVRVINPQRARSVFEYDASNDTIPFEFRKRQHDDMDNERFEKAVRTIVEYISKEYGKPTNYDPTKINLGNYRAVLKKDNDLIGEVQRIATIYLRFEGKGPVNIRQPEYNLILFRHPFISDLVVYQVTETMKITNDKNIKPGYYKVIDSAGYLDLAGNYTPVKFDKPKEGPVIPNNTLKKVVAA